MKRKYDARMVDDAVHACRVYCAVSMSIEVGEEELQARTRDRNTLTVRAAVMWFLRTHGQLSLQEIGHRMNRDHSSVLSLLRRVHDLIENDELTDLAEYAEGYVHRRVRNRAHEIRHTHRIGA